MENITIPDSVTSIGGFAFEYCDSLKSITIPSSIKDIGILAFYGGTSLKTVNYKGSEEQWKKISIDSGNSRLEEANIIYKENGES